MRKIFAVIFILLLPGCAGKQTLSILEMVDEIQIEQVYPKQELLILNDKEKIKDIIAFLNSEKHGWSGPWYSAPVGQVYLNLYKGKKYIGNFYVGLNFFGRDNGALLSHAVSDEVISQLGALLGLDLLGIIYATW